MSPAQTPPLDADRMTPRELRASVSLASIFALRMLGLFLILPVFAVHARTLPGGDDAAAIGFAMGVYGLTQGCLQIPFGIASDRLGRRRVMIAGLVLFVAGSAVAALAQDLAWLTIGRALQGAGAISAAVTAAIADATRDSQRTKAMAMVGASIGGTFALSLVASPALYAVVGLSGLFWLTAALSIAGIVVVARVVPFAPVGGPDAPARAIAPRWREVVGDPDLLRLNLGVFVLHVSQMAMFVVVPGWLVERAGLPLADHWKLYLPVVLGSFLVMMRPLMKAERRGRLKPVFVGAIALLLAVEAGFAWLPSGLVAMTALLLAFFVAFNVLEASLPSLVSRIAPPAAKGLALGVYNTTQALGLFAGGALGGAISARWGGPAVFATIAVLTAVWLALAPGLRRWPGRRVPATGATAGSGAG